MTILTGNWQYAARSNRIGNFVQIMIYSNYVTIFENENVKNVKIARQPVALQLKGNDQKQKFVFRRTSVDADEEGVRGHT